MELNPMERMTLDVIEEIQSMKRDGGKSPDLATMIEIENSFKVELKEALNKLVRNGIIEWHKNVNGVLMFGVKK